MTTQICSAAHADQTTNPRGGGYLHDSLRAAAAPAVG
jgi:hypothetical protein